MSLISILIMLLAAGIVLYLINRFVADPSLRKIGSIIVIVIVIIWFVSLFLGGSGILNYRVD